MPVQMIELEEVTMVEGNDDLLEIAGAALQRGLFTPTAICATPTNCC